MKMPTPKGWATINCLRKIKKLLKRIAQHYNRKLSVQLDLIINTYYKALIEYEKNIATDMNAWSLGSGQSWCGQFELVKKGRY